MKKLLFHKVFTGTPAIVNILTQNRPTILPQTERSWSRLNESDFSDFSMYQNLTVAAAEAVAEVEAEKLDRARQHTREPKLKLKFNISIFLKFSFDAKDRTESTM